MNDDAFLDEMIAEAAKTQGVVVKRDDPLMAAVLLNKAILERYLHQAVGPIQQAIAEAATRAQQTIADASTQAQQDIRAHAREQALYIDGVMLKDREKFVTEQKAALEALDERLLNRDAALVKLMTDIMEKARATLAAEVAATREKGWMRRLEKQKDRAGFGPLETGIAIGIVTTVGGAWGLIALFGGQ